MRKPVRYTLAWLTISVAVGLITKIVFDVSFVLATIMAGIVLILNGMLAYWEDRGTFND